MTNGSVTSEIAPSRSELDPSSVSARAFEPLTRSLFGEAGLQAGMRVLDVCSGAGHVALLAREIVGSGRHVTGIDPSAATVAYATERADFRGLNNVDFIQAKLEDLPFERQFDAVVGRLVLMYRKDPAQDIRRLARYLSPGGLVIFQELDLLAVRAVPPTPLMDQVQEWILSALAGAQIDLEMGPKLYLTFKAAGLTEPQMLIDGFIGGSESICPALVANVVARLLPEITAWGIARIDEIDIDTLEDRIRADLARTTGVVSLPLMIGAWAKVPT